MQYYKIRRDGLKEIRKQTLIKTLPVLLIALTVGITISSINSKNAGIALPIFIPFMMVTVGFGIYRGGKRQGNLLESYQLTLTNNLITREQANTPTVSIYFNEIKEIVKNKNGSFVIRGKDSSDVIGIPAQIENYSELEDTLMQIKPFGGNVINSFLQRYGIAISFFTMALMLCVYTVTNKIIVAISGTILVAILLWSFYEIRKSKNIDARTKRGMWWLLLVLASIIGVMVIKLIGIQKFANYHT
ncbi:MAG: hypothetical protein QM802_09695 [Agriterribacter sp.]